MASNMAGVNAYKDKVVDRLWKGLQSTIVGRKVEVVYGEGRLLSPTSVGVGGDVYEGGHAVLATGSQPNSLPGLAIDGQRVISSDHALTLDRVPGSVVILGGGAIGVEFASVRRSFGAEVTIVEMLPHLLSAEEESSSMLLERALRRRGISYQVGARFEGVKESDEGITVTLEAARPSTPSCCCWRRGAPRCRRAWATRPRGHRGPRVRAGGRVLPDQRSDHIGGG